MEIKQLKCQEDLPSIGGRRIIENLLPQSSVTKIRTVPSIVRAHVLQYGLCYFSAGEIQENTT
jgi:hypothetical protein